MKKLILLILCGVLTFGQSSAGKHFTVASPANAVLVQGVTVNFTYSLPADDPFVLASATDPTQAPTTIIWYWGDDLPNAQTRNFTQIAYKSPTAVSHVYTKAGTYGVMVLVNDAKNRSVRQDGINIKISQPVEVQ